MGETTTVLETEFKSPRNMFQANVAEARQAHDAERRGAGSIHDDAVATKLGFKGGTVPGSVHMNQLAPLIMQIYGEAWLERGSLSSFFTQATVDNERTRAVAERGAERARLRQYNEAGDQISENTASLDPEDPGAELVRRMAMQDPPAEGRLRILADFRIGDETHGTPVKVTREALLKALETITEDLPIYREKGVLPPGLVVHLAHITRPTVLARAKNAVGLFGALEIRNLKGPILADVDYVARTKILKLSESPKTENVWYDVTISDPKTKDDVGVVRFQIRLMKGSSPLWADEMKA
ncbi:MAG TPA: hypothetical protein VKT30_17510, partial [Caulobacteraceae bacterium]|nr:hypothetical protein [Caulobacteraceae bacterium]